MQRKYRLGDGLLTTTDLEAMNKEDFMTIGAFVQEFRKRARKVHGISEEAQCVIFLGLLIASEAVELTRHGGGSTKLTWATIDRGVEVGCLDQVEQRQVRLQRQKRKERDATASGTSGVTRIVTDVLAQLGYATKPVVQRRVVTVVKVKGKEPVIEEAGQEELWEEEEPVPQHLTKVQRKERTLMVELMKRKHRAYAFSDEERGRLDVDKIPMIRIHTVPHEPWNMRGARYPNPDEERKVVDYLDGKIRTHVADYSSEPYASPWFCFITPNGTLRWVQDLQRLNAVTVRDAGGLPNADALSKSCPGRPTILLIDLNSGYDQFPVYPSDRPVTAMHTPRGLVHMNVASQRWTNAVTMVQRAMIRAMQSVSPHITQPYIDNLAVKGPTMKESDKVSPGVRRFVWKHIQDLENVLILLEEHNLMASGAKSRHCMREATILGIVCNKKGRRPDVKKTDKITEWPVPFLLITDVRSFLGTCGFWRAFVKNFAAKTEHLRKLVRQDQEWVWGEEQEEVVTKMKEKFREGGSDFTKTAMPRGGRGTRLPRRPLGASGEYERHGPRHQECTPVYDDGDIELFLDSFWDHARRMGWTVAQAIEGVTGVGRFEEPARIRREATTRSEVEWRMQELRPSPVGPDGRPIRLEIENVADFIPAFEWFMQGQVEFHRFTEGGLRRSPAHTREEPPVSEGPLRELETHLDISQWKASPQDEKHEEQVEGVPREEVPQEEVPREEAQGTQQESRLGDMGRRAGKEVIEVGWDTPPQAPAMGLRLGDAPGSARQAEERLRREGAPLPSSERAPSPEGRAGRRRERAAVRREALTLIDRHLAAYALEHPDLEEPAPAEPRREPYQLEKGMEAEIPKRVDLRTRERAPAEETAEEKRARRTRRIDEIWQERQRLEAAGELPEQQQER
ncbi:hypothetical protein CBR_g20056 [Chara braunii]|uniref:Reverse transcriptase domain-containing protein n=1 Tax=Chara braunii TaxID=69332 RepID=A0A388KZE7_CHABU|nr:hypothetical protein CBR_g20056 [Chara braunii]|eukprot:GBG75426.1 hypothetical protein CBR_g20056 [Chara braunii]